MCHTEQVEHQETLPAILRDALPALQAVYLFGSCADGTSRPQSDLNLAVLLPHVDAKAAGRGVDLINLRTVSTVFRHEIVTTGIPIFFEMITLSLYQKLNEERAEILRSVRSDGRAYAV